jgi:hypothetical protein
MEEAMRRLQIETVDTVREVNRWEIPRLEELIPDWDKLTSTEQTDRLEGLIGEGAEFCKTLEGETIDRELLSFELFGTAGPRRSAIGLNVGPRKRLEDAPAEPRAEEKR